ncbi:hypothetical protein F4821DRAFT_226588 [Hypoxylon rubiginosum]|uniref:Uncharacterized protein n=1 Tax=Hypoxylon rubiginosum TaxID=110542 RepID=A0ACC0DHH9_9PEZI|nr:hypothetical protein F4821DRAFT_226588 [Hypoxylon rubiginosum]
MAPSTTKSDDKPQFNARELEVIAKAWTCISEVKNGVPVIDATKLAERGPYASADSARHVWRPIQKKLIAIAGAGSDVTTPTPTPGKGRGRKRKTDAADTETPTKKPRARKNTKAPAEKDVDEDDHLTDGEA